MHPDSRKKPLSITAWQACTWTSLFPLLPVFLLSYGLTSFQLSPKWKKFPMSSPWCGLITPCGTTFSDYLRLAYRYNEATRCKQTLSAFSRRKTDRVWISDRRQRPESEVKKIGDDGLLSLYWQKANHPNTLAVSRGCRPCPDLTLSALASNRRQRKSRVSSPVFSQALTGRGRTGKRERERVKQKDRCALKSHLWLQSYRQIQNETTSRVRFHSILHLQVSLAGHQEVVIHSRSNLIPLTTKNN